MNKNTVFFLLSALISFNGQAMESAPDNSLAKETMAGTTDSPRSALSTEIKNSVGALAQISRENTPANLPSRTTTKDEAIQVESDFLLSPNRLFKKYLSRATGYSVLTGMASLAAGTVAAIGTEALCQKYLPETLSWKTKNHIISTTTNTALWGTYIYTAYKILSHLDNNLVPGGIPAGFVLHEETIITNENGQTKTRTLRYYAPKQAENTILEYDADKENEETCDEQE